MAIETDWFGKHWGYFTGAIGMSCFRLPHCLSRYSDSRYPLCVAVQKLYLERHQHSCVRARVSPHQVQISAPFFSALRTSEFCSACRSGACRPSPLCRGLCKKALSSGMLRRPLGSAPAPPRSSIGGGRVALARGGGSPPPGAPKKRPEPCAARRVPEGAHIAACMQLLAGFCRPNADRLAITLESIRKEVQTATTEPAETLYQHPVEVGRSSFKSLQSPGLA